MTSTMTTAAITQPDVRRCRAAAVVRDAGGALGPPGLGGAAWGGAVWAAAGLAAAGRGGIVPEPVEPPRPREVSSERDPGPGPGAARPGSVSAVPTGSHWAAGTSRPRPATRRPGQVRGRRHGRAE